jgi:hypothetical protein
MNIPIRLITLAILTSSVTSWGQQPCTCLHSPADRQGIRRIGIAEILSAPIIVCLEGSRQNPAVELTSFQMTFSWNIEQSYYQYDSNRLSIEQLAGVMHSKPGDMIFIENIMFKMPNGTMRKLSPRTLIIDGL